MKCKYRVRWFSSKGAFLVLLWTLLITISCSLLVHTIDNRDAGGISVRLKWISTIPLLLSVIVSAPLSGWLADAKLGNFKVFRVGAVLLFISTVITCLFMILEEVWESNHVLKWICLCLGVSLFAVGGCACFVTALPLGLDQMPDASSSSITSYIAWYVCILSFGGFSHEVLDQFINEINGNIYLVLALIAPLCVGIVLVINFLCHPKWLIIEPKSPQSLKTIYQVLKFAAKHKAPLNRSAFTYWEEDIPSRIDLGKSKYGGPFTIEQVEDVKTILRLIAITSPLFIVSLSLTFRTYGISPNIMDIHSFTSDILHLFDHSSAAYAILTTVAF